MAPTIRTRFLDVEICDYCGSEHCRCIPDEICPECGECPCECEPEEGDEPEEVPLFDRIENSYQGVGYDDPGAEE